MGPVPKGEAGECVRQKGSHVLGSLPHLQTLWMLPGSRGHRDHAAEPARPRGEGQGSMRDPHILEPERGGREGTSELMEAYNLPGTTPSEEDVTSWSVFTDRGI